MDTRQTYSVLYLDLYAPTRLSSQFPTGHIRCHDCTPASNKVKLPKLALPKFGGELLKWTSFWISYESTVHNSRDLNGMDKFNYLRSLLERMP